MIYNCGLNIMLTLMKLMNKLYNIFSFIFYRFGGIIDSCFGHLLGLDDYWYFFDGHIYPIQAKYVNGYSKHDARWIYNKRTHVWKPVGRHSSQYFYMPWVSSSIFALNDKENNTGIEIQCTNFITNQKIYRQADNRRYFPTVEHLFGAWSIQHKAIFTLQETANVTFEVFTLDAEELSIPVISLVPSNLYKQSLCGHHEEVFEIDDESEQESGQESGQESSNSEKEIESLSETESESKEEPLVNNENLPVMDMGIIRARQDTCTDSVMSESNSSSSSETNEKVKEE